MSDKRITTDDLTDEQIERIVNSRGFQKMLAYSRLAEGIGVLREQDEIYDSMVEAIRKQHSNVGSRNSVEEFFDLFVTEVEAFTEPLLDENGTELDSDTVEDLYVEDDDR